MLLIRRAKEPAKGKLAPPGGFIDVGETAEQGVRREVREEVGIELDHIHFLCSQPNQYFYKEVTYPVLDFFFTARALNADGAAALRRHRELWREHPERELYFVHTNNRALEIAERPWVGIRKNDATAPAR